MKHLVAIADANERHRNIVSDALVSHYTVNAYNAPSNAISGMHICRPRLILVGQKVGTGSGANFIKDLRKENYLADIPIIFLIDSEDYRIIDLMREMGIKDYLVKPYHRSALFNTISKLVNGKIERTWIDLAPTQRKALEGTLSAFNVIADDIANGKALPFGTINESCSALVEVVSKEELGEFLHKIKDHDNFTYVHSLRFSALLTLFAKAIGLPKAQQLIVASGGLLHDLGMMTIPRSLLNKQGKLTANEMNAVRGHVAISRNMLATTDAIPKGVFTIVTHHHERLDGSGYPHGLLSRDLNELARMAAIIDVFCALTDRRTYRRTVPAHVALEIIATEMKSQLDQDLLLKFREILLDTMKMGEERGVAS